MRRILPAFPPAGGGLCRKLASLAPAVRGLPEQPPKGPDSECPAAR